MRDECRSTVKHDLLYNIAMENREFADLLFTLITTDSDRHCMYTGLWTSGLRQRLGEGLSCLHTNYTKKKLEEWKKILVRTGQTLTQAARSLSGLRFQEVDEMPRHTAMSFKERIAEARRDKAGRKSEQAKKRKKALARKKNRLISLGLVNKNPLSEGENPLSLGDGNSSSTVDEHAHNFLDTLLDLLESEGSQGVVEAFSIGGVT